MLMYLKSLLLGVAATMVAALGLVGCGHSCNAMGCVTGVNVVFSRGLDASKTYDVQVVVDGDHRSCSVAANQIDGCGVTGVFTTGEPVAAADGTLYPANGFAGLHLSAEPALLEVTVSDSGNIMGTGKFDPVGYRGVEINGPGCGTCQQGMARLEME